MKLKKSQFRLIMALNVVLALLIAAIAFEYALGKKTKLPAGAETPDGGDATPPITVVETPPAPYEKFRSARISLSPALELETNVGGSGDETIVDAFTYKDKIYVFGNTGSTDLDMEGADGKAFMAVLNSDLATENFRFLGESGEKLARVIIAEGGYLLALEKDGAIILRLISPEGYEFIFTSAYTATAATVADLKLFDGKYGLISSVVSSPLSKTKLFFQIFDYSLKLTYERMIDSPYSLGYIDCFELKGVYTMFFNASSDLNLNAGAAVCSELPEPQITYIDKGGSFRAFDAVPVADGWALSVIYEGGDGGIMLVGKDFKKKNMLFGYETPRFCSLYFSGGLFYVSFYGENGRVTDAYDADFGQKRRVEAYSSFTDIAFVLSGNGYSLFFGSTDCGLRVVGSSDICDLTFADGSVKPVKLLKSGDDVFAVCLSSGVSTDIAGWFGGTDVWLARLKL